MLEEGVHLLCGHVADLIGEHLQDTQRDLHDAKRALEQQDIPESLGLLEVDAAREQRAHPVLQDGHHLHLVLLEGVFHVRHLFVHRQVERRAVVSELALHVAVHSVHDVLREQIHGRGEGALLVLELQQHGSHVVQTVKIADVGSVGDEGLQQLLQISLEAGLVELGLVGVHICGSGEDRKRTLHRLGDLQNGLLVALGGGVGVLRMSGVEGTNRGELLAQPLAVLDVDAIELGGDADLGADHHVPALHLRTRGRVYHDAGVGKHSLVANLLRQSTVALVLPLRDDLLRELHVLVLALLLATLLKPAARQQDPQHSPLETTQLLGLRLFLLLVRGLLLSRLLSGLLFRLGVRVRGIGVLRLLSGLLVGLGVRV